MKKNILITEKKLLTLVKSIMKENIQNMDPNEFGCYKLLKGSENKEWCDTSAKYISLNIEKVKNIVKNVESDLKKEENRHLQHNLKHYDEYDEFFSQNLENLETLKENLTYCEKGIIAIEKFKKTLPGKAIFVYKVAENYEYSLLNKLNTNYSALAYLLTQYRLKNNLLDLTTEQVFKKYFEQGEFYKIIMNYFDNKEYEIELFKEVFNTISNTTKRGRETEVLAIKMLNKHYGEENIIDFAGDYSFVDMMGVDVLVFSKKMGKWIPVQIKSREKDCKGNYRFCENICMTITDGTWIFKKYIGDKEVKSF